jgi:hypothetical protein
MDEGMTHDALVAVINTAAHLIRHYQPPCQNRKLADKLMVAADALAAATAENEALRELLFLTHASEGHYLYGDDGEMQCNACGCDFKRDSPQQLNEKITRYSMAALAKESGR